MRSKAFTLPELIVGLAISAMLMLGISTFFSSAFNRMFTAQEEANQAEKKFIITEMIRDVFINMKSLAKEWEDYAILAKIKHDSIHKPFTYIGAHDIEENTHLVFKDLFLFNDMEEKGGTHYYIDPDSSGYTKNALNHNIALSSLASSEEIFGGFLLIGPSDYYIALPDKNKVISKNSPDGMDLGEIKLDHPTDISKADGADIYISDSGNNRIIRYKSDLATETFGTDLDFPTGLAGYGDYLFVADTNNNKVKRIKLLAPNQYRTTTVIGEGSGTECKGSARFCALNTPTGVYAYGDELFIADSGNNRILKVKDPGEPDEFTITYSLTQNYALQKIELSNAEWTGQGTYDDLNSNLPGGSFDPAAKDISGFGHLTTYSVDPCQSADKTLFINEPRSNTDVLQAGDKLMISNELFTFEKAVTYDCDPDPNITLNKTKITVTENAAAVPDSKTVYFTNPISVTLKINGPFTFAEGASGYKTIEIKTYSPARGLVSTDYYSFTLGDGTLGTEEDIVQVIAENTPSGICPAAPMDKRACVLKEGDPDQLFFLDNPIIFPTGTTNAYFISTGNSRLNKLLLQTDEANNQINIFNNTAIEKYDYVSDFTVDEMKFSKFNNDSILELKLKTANQPYSLNANLR